MAIVVEKFTFFFYKKIDNRFVHFFLSFTKPTGGFEPDQPSLYKSAALPVELYRHF